MKGRVAILGDSRYVVKISYQIIRKSKHSISNMKRYNIGCDDRNDFNADGNAAVSDSVSISVATKTLFFGVIQGTSLLLL